MTHGPVGSAGVGTLDEHDPRHVGPYVLLGQLGAGGMGRVYLAADAAGRRVAVKVVHPGLAHDPRFRARFAREVAVGSRVHGPWTAALLDADPSATPPWLATEFVPGPSLDRAVRDAGPVPPDAMWLLALGLARALATIHAAGLLHRDVKPSNVLLAADGPRLIDFGIARAVAGTRLTSTGGVVGTPSFMSPEQVSGGELGPASDVFSLGGVLVFAATGTGQFGQGTPLSLLRRVLTAPPDLGALAGPLREVAAGCLRRDPADRPTPAQLVDRLQPSDAVPTAWLPPEITTLRVPVEIDPAPPAPAPPSGLWIHRRTFLAGAVVLGLVGVGTAATLIPRSASHSASVRWSFRAGGEVRGVAVSGGTVYVAAEDKLVSALDAATGQRRWSHQVGTPYDAPMVVGSTVLAEGVALDAATGTRVGAEIAASSASVLAARADVIVGYVIDGNGPNRTDRVVVFDPATRAQRWSSRPLGGLVTGSGMAAHLSTDAVHCSKEELDATFDLASGAQLWTRQRAASDYQHTAASGSLFYRIDLLGDARTALLALDARSGEQRWRAELDGRPHLLACVESPAAVYAAESQKVFAWDGTTGALRWVWDLSGGGSGETGSLYQLAASGTTVFVASSRVGQQQVSVVAIDAITGSTRWQLAHPGQVGPFGVGLAIADSLVVVTVGPAVYTIVAG